MVNFVITIHEADDCTIEQENEALDIAAGAAEELTTELQERFGLKWRAEVTL